VADVGSISKNTWYGVSGSRSQLDRLRSICPALFFEEALLPSFPGLSLSLSLSFSLSLSLSLSLLCKSKATMKVLFCTMIYAILAILSLTVCLWLTPGSGSPRPSLTSSIGEREPATPTEAAVDNYNNNNNNKASRDHDLQPTTTTKATTTATALTTTKALPATTTSAMRMRQERPSPRHRSLVFANLFAWIKKIFCYIFGQKFGFCSPPTPECLTGPKPFTNRQQLVDALAEFFTHGYTISR
jgi:hypothetical protein